MRMHSLARNFALLQQLKENICKEMLKEFGTIPHLSTKMFTWVKLMVVDVLPLENV
jgi:hypothetical protein